MKNKSNKTFYIFAVLFFIFACTLLQFVGVGVTANAAVANYTGVLDDLQKDENFDVNDYPRVSGDYSVEVIAIAESENGELFVYAYHHIGSTVVGIATSINISTTIKQNLQYDNYKLVLLDSNETLYKYIVYDFKVKSDVVRYYDISSIYRKPLPSDSTSGVQTNEKAFAVGQFWTVCTVGDQVTYNREDVEIITVTQQTVGFRRYQNSFNPLVCNGNACDAHFLAFSCDHDIDFLISADLQFYTQEYEISKGKETLGKKEKNTVTLYWDEYAENGGGGWFGVKKRWNRIATKEEFLNTDLGFSEKDKAYFAPYDWVLNFYETEFDTEKNLSNYFDSMLSYWSTGDPTYLFDVSGTRVSEVTLMRLEFEYNGTIYNLGVVSDKQTGGMLGDTVWHNPFAPDGSNKMPWWGWVIIGGIVLIVLVVLVLIFPVIRPIFTVIGKVIAAIFKGLWWIICLPFRGIKALIANRKDKEN